MTMPIMKTISATIILLATTTLGVADEIYKIDNSHASIAFSVSHLVISKVKGGFAKFDGNLTLDDKGKLKAADASIDVNSINTGVEKRDEHLRSVDFFDVANHPEITFKATKVQKRDGKDLLIGKFTIHGVTRILELPYTVKGPITDPWGNKKIGFAATTVINRGDYGLNWNKALETGGVIVGEEVEISIDLEAGVEK